ncbi:uncharacterized protein [Halyomorpha halys]|uniref:uncharacterized protein isoform X2 n=1 Tax=Halyomorpha halys TaxID=286706 RepID=UPI0006D519C1|nr:uncharacterized protein LOC106682333 isoform X2 [Halyomorpha halys]
MIDEDFQYFEDGDSEGNHSIFISLLIAFVLIVLFVRVVMECFEIKRRKNVKFAFDVLFELHMKYRYHQQPRDTLVVLKNGVRSILGPHTRRPAVLLLMSADDGKMTAMELATRLTQVTFAAMGNRKTEEFIRENLVIDGSYFSGLIDFWEFYNIISSKLKKYKMVIVYNFEVVHPHAVTVLPSLTHEIFCPQTQALIILIMGLNCYHHPITSDFSSTRLACSSVEQTFGPSLDNGQLDDLMRTVTARSALVLPEKLLSEEN